MFSSMSDELEHEVHEFLRSLKSETGPDWEDVHYSTCKVSCSPLHTPRICCLYFAEGSCRL